MPFVTSFPSDNSQNVMVRFMAENGIENPEEIKGFNRLGYIFRDDLSSETEYVFERRGK